MKTLVNMNTLLHKEKTCLDVRTNLSDQFEDWFCKECKMKSKTSNNCKNLYKLINCMVTQHILLKS